MANWSSYEEAAKAGYSNIATRHEWARTSNKMGYNTYQDYLNGMYAKYISGVNPASKADSGSGEKESTGSSSGAISTGSSGLENYSSEGGKTSPKYQGSDFLDWYSSNYGKAYDQNQGFSRAEGMSDVDWDIGNEAFKYYVSGQNVDNQYKNNINALEQNKKNAQQNASITLDKLKKYLPTQVKAQGLGGLGVSESTMLQAYNNYNNQMGQITGDYNRNKTSLEEAYGSKKSDLDLAANEAVNNIAKNYSNKFESEQKGAQDLLYNEFVSKVQSGSFNTTSELEALYERIKGKLSEEQRIVIEGELNTLKNNPSQQTIDKAYEKEIEKAKGITDYFKINTLDSGNKIKALNSSKDGSAAWHDDHADNIGINVNGKVYGVEMGDEVPKSEQTEIKEYLKSAHGRDPKEGDAIFYNGQIAVVCTNGNIRYVKDRSKFWAWNWGASGVNDLIGAVNYD